MSCPADSSPSDSFKHRSLAKRLLCTLFVPVLCAGVENVPIPRGWSECASLCESPFSRGSQPAADQWLQKYLTYLSCFTSVYGRKANPVIVSPSRLEVDVLINPELKSRISHPNPHAVLPLRIRKRSGNL